MNEKEMLFQIRPKVAKEMSWECRGFIGRKTWYQKAVRGLEDWLRVQEKSKAG